MTEPIAKSNKLSEGSGLIEVLVALLILVLVMLAFLQAVTLYTRHNMNDILRDEATRITQDTLYGLRAQDFQNTNSGAGTIAGTNCTTPGKTVIKKLRTGADFPFRVCWTVSTDSLNSHRTVTAVTSWTIQGQVYSQRASTVVSIL